jgi:exonuclease VII small subunit
MADTPRAATPLGSVAHSEFALPPAGTQRWVAKRKAQVVEAIQNGQLTLDEAWRRYRLGVEEFGAWKRALLRAGVKGLGVARSRAETLRKPGGRPSADGGKKRHG